MTTPPALSRKDDLPLPPPKNASNAFFRNLARRVLRHRFALLAFMVVLTAAVIFIAATRLRIDSSTEAFLSSNDNSSIVLEELRDAFGQDTVFQILVTGDVFSLDYLDRLRNLQQDVEALDMDLETLGQRRHATDRDPERSPLGDADEDAANFADFGDSTVSGDEGWGEEAGGSIVEQVISLINVRKTHFQGGSMRVSGLLDQWPKASDLPGLKKEVLADKTLVGQVVGADGKHSVLVVRTQFMSEADSARVYKALLAIASKHEGANFKVEVAGSPALFVALNARMMSDLALTLGVSTFLMLIIMVYLFRHPLGVVGPLFVCLQAAACTMAALALFDRPVTLVTNVLPAFLVCVGMGDSIHVQSVYRDARKNGHSNTDAIIYATGATGVPILFTSLTTAVGLLSFGFAHLQAIQDMGMFGALGVMIALFNSLVALPIVLSFNTTSLFGADKATSHKRIDKFLGWCNNLSRKPGSRRLVLVIAAVCALVAGLAASTLRVYHNALVWFPEEDIARSSVEHLDSNVGGMATISLLIEAPQGQTLKHRDTMLALEKLEHHVLAYRDPQFPGGMITNTTSLLDVVRESWRAAHENDPAFYAVPNSERGVQDMLTLFENAGPNELSRLATIDMSKSVVTLRAHWVDAWSYRPLVEHIEAGVPKFFPSGVTVKTTGTVYSTVSVVDTLIGDLLRSFGAAFIVIAVFMVLLLRDLRLGLIAMVPNFLPILMTAAYMVPAHIHVDTSTLMVASIAIGIAVDDTIHFLHQFHAHMLAHHDVEAAIDHAFSHTGRAMIATSVILIAGFFAMNVGYMGNVKVFGTLISITVVLALLADLIFCPALLRAVYGERAPRQ